MNKIFLGLGILASSMAMVSCSQDDFDNGNNSSNDESRFYTQFTISLPTTGSRATGDTPVKEEVGKDGENKINTLSIVLMEKQSDQSFKYVASTTVTNVAEITNNVKPTYQAIFPGEEIKTHYKNSDERKLWMFVVANQRGLSVENGFDPVQSSFETNMYIGYDPKRALIMSGAPYQVTLPETLNELMQYDTANRPYNLTVGGAVPVERAIARFDFKTTNGNVYEIKDNVSNTTRGKIQLLDMAVVNERATAYHFGRSSENGKNENFKFELVSNQSTFPYVVTPKADNIKSRAFYSTLSKEVTSTTDLNQGEGYFWTSIASLNDSYDDNDNNWNDGSFGDYKIWRYVNENTIPHLGASGSNFNNDQTWKNSTGVVFRGTILDTKVGDDETTGIPGYGNGSLYLFQNELFGNFAALKAAASAVEGGNIANPVLKHYFEATWGNIETAVEDTFLKNQTPAENGFTVYRNEGDSTTPLYYTYYYYWNRHEDNFQANLMGHMEFAVVRNNVYKLAVNSINRFGHTTNPDDDPDPINPDDPDEDENIYFQVNVSVLPWTVRVNNIDF